jgi:two-component system sensor histidine kinase YesM
MLRASLCGQDMHSLRSEMELLESYIAIQKIRFEERLLFTMELQEGLDGVPIPKLTLQPLVENSISYGLERFSRPCRIHVKAQQMEGDVVIAVSDNGPGMEQEFVARIFSGEITPKGTGLGIKNIHERVRLAFGEAYGVQFESRPGKGTTACVRIPFDADGKEE